MGRISNYMIVKTNPHKYLPSPPIRCIQYNLNCLLCRHPFILTISTTEVPSQQIIRPHLSGYCRGACYSNSHIEVIELCSQGLKETSNCKLRRTVGDPVGQSNLPRQRRQHQYLAGAATEVGQCPTRTVHIPVEVDIHDLMQDIHILHVLEVRMGIHSGTQYQ